jgi:hypothetical protein
VKPFIALILILASGVAFAHGEQGWMIPYLNASGQSCCDERDTVAIPNGDAAAARVGDTLLAPFASGAALVKINKIYATEDKQGRAMISAHGCLFRQFGG